MVLPVLYHFNSIKVRLEPIQGIEKIYEANDFNSIKVRLEHSCQERTEAASRFQFHKGAIRTSFSVYFSSSTVNFNSIKVRLERLKILKVLLISLFQFHKGAIRTMLHLLRCVLLSVISIP